MPTLPTSSATSPPDHPRRLPPTWREMHPEDDPAVEALQFAGWAAATPAENLIRAGQLIAGVRLMAYLSLVAEMPGGSDVDLRVRFAERLLGPQLARGLIRAAVPVEGVA